MGDKIHLRRMHAYRSRNASQFVLLDLIDQNFVGEDADYIKLSDFGRVDIDRKDSAVLVGVSASYSIVVSMCREP